MARTDCPLSVLQEYRRAQRADNPATIFAIGTANPVNCLSQDEYADWYFHVTKSDHLATLKAKMKRICEKSGIKKRYFWYTEEMISSHPEFADRTLPSLSTRLSIILDAVPELAATAARKAIAERGRAATDITHLLVSTNSGCRTPGADLHLAALLGLRPTVHRTLLYLHGCFGGSSVLRMAKDIAENNRGARLLVVCSEVFTLLSFGAPDEAHVDALVGMALFGDGAGAVIVGADPIEAIERPIFVMVSASQVTLPGTENALTAQLGDSGLHFRISAEVPKHVHNSIRGCLVDTLAPLGLTNGSGSGDWNSLSWMVHPGGRAILDSCEAALVLEPRKLAASRHVLSEYGNMGSATIIFVLDEMRRRRQSADEMEGDMCDSKWAVMLGIGPGITIETMVLHTVDSSDEDLLAS